MNGAISERVYSVVRLPSRGVKEKWQAGRSRLTESTESLDRVIVAPKGMTFHDCDP